MFSATDLENMRATTLASLPDTCTIQTKTVVSDGQGGQTESYNTSASNVPIRVKADNIKTAEIIAQDGVRLQQTYTATFAYDRVLNKTDRIVWNGKTLEVITSLDNSWQLHKHYSCVEVV
jgi:SPP1 family predicted phage head-tail adaptor